MSLTSHRDTFSHPGLPNVSLVLLLQPEHRGVRQRYFQATRDALSKYGTWFVPYPYPVLTIVDPPYGSGAGGSRSAPGTQLVDIGPVAGERPRRGLFGCRVSMAFRLRGGLTSTLLVDHRSGDVV